MDKILRRSLIEAWRDRPDEIRFKPASEDQLRRFEALFGVIPADFRWFLAECGGGVVGSEWVDGIDELAESHRKFQEECVPGGWTMKDVFVIGWDGWGNPFGIQSGTGRILFEDHNFGGVHELAESFAAFLVKGLRL